jgi:hypothetical protein
MRPILSTLVLISIVSIVRSVDELNVLIEEYNRLAGMTLVEPIESQAALSSLPAQYQSEYDLVLRSVLSSVESHLSLYTDFTIHPRLHALVNAHEWLAHYHRHQDELSFKLFSRALEYIRAGAGFITEIADMYSMCLTTGDEVHVANVDMVMVAALGDRLGEYFELHVQVVKDAIRLYSEESPLTGLNALESDPPIDADVRSRVEFFSRGRQLLDRFVSQYPSPFGLPDFNGFFKHNLETYLTRDIEMYFVAIENVLESEDYSPWGVVALNFLLADRPVRWLEFRDRLHRIHTQVTADRAVRTLWDTKGPAVVEIEPIMKKISTLVEIFFRDPIIRNQLMRRARELVASAPTDPSIVQMYIDNANNFVNNLI